jgi:hypothetical protein
MKPAAFLFTILIGQYFCFAQIKISGIVLDSLTNEPIEFANAGVLYKNTGTVTDSKGNFQLSILDSLKNSILRVSCIGYAEKDIIINSINPTQEIIIKLQPSVKNLKEVVIIPKKNKIKVLGIASTRKTKAGYTANKFGAEMALKIDIKNTPATLKAFSFNIVSNKYDSVIFRFNVYNVDSNGFPKDNILKQSIFIIPEVKTGLVTVNLLKYNVVVEEDIFISLEWVMASGGEPELYISANLFSGGTYFRRTSQDKWQKFNGFGAGLNITIEY